MGVVVTMSHHTLLKILSKIYPLGITFGQTMHINILYIPLAVRQNYEKPEYFKAQNLLCLVPELRLATTIHIF